jgi:hypothetical protein
VITLQKAEHAIATVALSGARARRPARFSRCHERAAFAVLGKICTAITDAGNAVAANGINVQLDAQEIADLKSIAAYLARDFGCCGCPKART